jgi:uncharacterized membrane protein
VVSAMSEHFRRSDFTAGLIAGIHKAAERLAAHFPNDPERATNELPDEVDIAGRS